eukprot:5545210-Alexandrium_andersonii.AAC.1
MPPQVERRVARHLAQAAPTKVCSPACRHVKGNGKLPVVAGGGTGLAKPGRHSAAVHLSGKTQARAIEAKE